MAVLHRVMDVIERICLIIASAFLALMAAVLMYQVIMRYVFNNATSWSDELATLMFVWAVMLVIPIGVRRHEHISVEYFIMKLPPIGIKVMQVLIYLATAFTMAIIGYFSLGLLESAGRQKLSGLTLSLGMDVPMSWMYIATPIGCAIVVLFCAERIANIVTSTPQWEERHPKSFVDDDEDEGATLVEEQEAAVVESLEDENPEPEPEPANGSRAVSTSDAAATEEKN